MIRQFILAGLVGAAVFFKFFYHKLIEIFGSADMMNLSVNRPAM